MSSANVLLQPLIALSDEGTAAASANLPWPGEAHEAIRASNSYSAFVEAAAATNPVLNRLMTGATLHVSHELGDFEVTTPDGAWFVARLPEDAAKLAASHGEAGREVVHRSLSRALDGVLEALESGRSRTTSYLGLRGLSLADADEVDVGVGV